MNIVNFRLLSAACIVTALLPLCFAGCSSPGDTQIKATIAHAMPEEHPTGMALTRFAESVHAKSDGNIILDVFPAGQLYTDKDMMQAVEAGITEIGMAYHGWWSGAVPSLTVLAMPFLFDDYEHLAQSVEGGLFDALDDELARANGKLLFWAYNAFGQLTSNRPVYEPDDIRGLKIRTLTIQDSKAIQACGGSPVSLGGGEVYMALQRGTVDGAISGTITFYVRQFFEVQDYATLVNMGDGSFIVVVNLDWWDSIGQANRDILMEAAAETQAWLLDEIIRHEEEVVEALRQTGQIEVIDLRYDEEIKARWKEYMQPLYEDILAETGQTGYQLIQIIEQSKPRGNN